MKKWMIMAAASILLALAVLAFLLYPDNENQKLSLAEAQAAVADLYGGKAGNSSETADSYLVDFTRNGGSYKAIVNKETGKVESIEQLSGSKPQKSLTEEDAKAIAESEAEGTVNAIVYSEKNNDYKVEVAGEKQLTKIILSAETGEIKRISTDAKEEEAEPERVITRDEAVEIAKKTLDGELQEIEFTETEDGGYYLVEIENDETDQEVTVQIHAIRGEILTVKWDD